MTAMRLETQLLEHIDRLRSRALRIGFAALALSAVSVFFDPTLFFRSYLFGYLFWIGVTLGSLAILMIHHLVGGKWGYVTRRTLEASTRVLPLMAVLFIPILFGLSEKKTVVGVTSFRVRVLLLFACGLDRVPELAVCTYSNDTSP